MPTIVSPIVQMNNSHLNSCSVTTNNKDTEHVQANAMNSINQIKTPSQTFISPSSVNTPIRSTYITAENPNHNVNSTLTCSLTEFCKSLQNATGVPSVNQMTTTAYRQVDEFLQINTLHLFSSLSSLLLCLPRDMILLIYFVHRIVKSFSFLCNILVVILLLSFKIMNNIIVKRTRYFPLCLYFLIELFDVLS